MLSPRLFPSGRSYCWTEVKTTFHDAGPTDQEKNILPFVLHIAGAAALLLWSVRLVRTGVERAFSVQLRLWLRRSEKSRLLAVLSGMLSALLLQSATAVAIMVSNFVSAGTLGAAVGLAVLLGADIGSALVVKVLLAKQAFMVPLLLLVGVAFFLRGSKRRIRQVGRIFIGLALILVSLDMIRDAADPLMNSAGITSAMRYLGSDLATAFIVGAIFTWLVHSSVAAILLVVTLVAQGLMPQSAAVAIVLGANLGGVIIAFILTLSSGISARRMILANALIRGGGAAAVLACFSIYGMNLSWLGQSDVAQLINLHVVFNLCLTVISMPFLKSAIAAIGIILPEKAQSKPAGARLSALDPSSLTQPDQALGCASREILHMGEVVAGMLGRAMPLYQTWDTEYAQSIRADEQTVRNAHSEVKLFLARLNKTGLTDTQASRSLELSTLAMNMDAAADLIARNMLNLAQRLDAEKVKFSPDGWLELTDFHDRVLGNIQSALNVMMTQEVDAARALIADKDAVRQIEQELQRKHLGRLQKGAVESIETSNIHQETLRALKQVNGHFALVSNPILAGSGILLNSRLSR